MDEQNNYVFFLSGYLSNWYRCRIEDEDGTVFNCMEQYLMYHKATLFNDYEMAKRILKTEQPEFQKGLGRKVRAFKDDIWKDKREEIAYNGLMLKFKQNSRLRKLLISTAPKMLVECNPKDNIWAIGMSKDDPNIMDTTKWGENLLGKTLTKVRDDIISKKNK